MERLAIVLLLAAVSPHRVAGIPLDQFYPFGPAVGDRSLLANDDDSTSAIVLTVPFPFFDEDHDTLFVNNNGLISFDEEVSSFTPDSFPLNTTRNSDQGLIAPFWADVDTRDNGGIVYYRDTADPGLLLRAGDEIQEAFAAEDVFYPTSLFIATWDHVGYYDRHSDMTNTFQCILATDGLRSFVTLLYADGEIQWTTGDASNGTNGIGGTPAQVGFDAGDGTRFASVPGSQMAEIIDIDQTSNVDRPGVWMFRVDEEDISFAGCINNTAEPRIALSPHYGSVLGGQSVIVTGPCFEERDTIICSFGVLDVNAVFIDEFRVLCVSPVLPRAGSVDFKLRGNRYTGEASFIALSIEQSYQVDVSLIRDDNSLLFTDGDLIEASWDPSQVFPLLPPSNYTVDISVHTLRDTNGQWSPLQQLLVDNVVNSGMQRVTVTLPVLDDVYPIVVQVSVHTADLMRLDPSTKNILERLDSPVGIWSGQFYYADNRVLSTSRSLCSSWSITQRRDIGDQLLDSATPCPPTASRASLLNSGVTEENYISFLGNTRYGSQWRDYFHPRTSVCYRQRLVSGRESTSTSTPAQHCCYDDSGDLVIGPDGGGSVYRSSPDISPVTHFTADIRPRILCCKASLPSCQTFFDFRPSDDGSRYDPQPPAWMLGDPHIVTLDGLRYTFNGLGEFTLLETTDSSLTIQGRMERATDSSGEAVGATVFTAIVAKTSDSDTVQFQTSRRGIDALVNGERAIFGLIRERDFNNVTVTSVEYGTISASFAGGVFIQVTRDNGFLSSLAISVPTSYKGKTQGLLGTYNGNEADDLMPKDSNDLLAADSSLREIHDSFGITWIIDNSMDSLFTYGIGESLDFFNDISFEPHFEPPFADPAAEQDAIVVCNGDSACVFDIATTGSMSIGLSTLSGSQNVEIVNQLSMPVVCNMPCDNGVCTDNNTCKCALGYSGERCTEPVYFECSDDPCKNGGTCVTHAGSVVCMCHSGYSGLNCEIPPDSRTYRLLAIVIPTVGGLLVVMYIVSLLAIGVLVYTSRRRRNRKRTMKSSASDIVKFSEEKV